MNKGGVCCHGGRQLWEWPSTVQFYAHTNQSTDHLSLKDSLSETHFNFDSHSWSALSDDSYFTCFTRLTDDSITSDCEKDCACVLMCALTCGERS